MAYAQARSQAVHQVRRYEDATNFRPRHFRWAAVAAVVLMAVAAHGIQDTTTKPAKPEDLAPLIEEIVHLQGKLERGVQLPALRSQSRLLPLAPASTTMYISLPNLGEVVGQVDQIFHQELKESPLLNDAWQTKAAAVAPMVEDALAKFQQFSQFLGNEIVTCSSDASNGSVIVMAEVRKPGLRAFLQQTLAQYGGKSTAILYSQQELLAATHAPKNKPLLVLVRPDFVIANSDLAALKRANAEINRGAGKFASTPFGQHMEQAYQSGVGMLFGMDFEALAAKRPKSSVQQEKMIQQSGFEDLKYLTMEGRYVGGVLTNNIQLTFKGPRRGVAAWLAAPAQIGGLDFISADTNMAGAIVFKTLANIFDEALKLSGQSSAEASLAQAEQELKINFKQDLISKLGPQLVFSVDGPLVPAPSWKVVLQVSDPEGLQTIFKQLMAAEKLSAKDGKAPSLEQETENGVTYYSLRSPEGQKQMGYAFVDGYLIIAASSAAVKDAVEVHRSGRSLGKSGELHALLPADHPNGVSALVYQNIGPLMGQVLGQQSPDIAQLVQPLAAHSKPSLMSAYGEPNGIHIVGTSRGLDLNMVLITAAIAIPNLLKARTAANDAGAVSNVRALNAAQAVYQADYPNRGFAPDLATLGSGPTGGCDKGGTETNACIIDSASWSAPDNGKCASGIWCAKGAYRYSISATCNKELCDDYVVVATPVDPSGGKSFCSTSDAVIRFQQGALGSPISPSECQAWPPQ
jgi:hypothetical protein